MKAVILKNLFGRKMLLPVSVKQLDEGGVSVLRDAATDEEFEITYTQLKRSSDAKGQTDIFTEFAVSWRTEHCRQWAAQAMPKRPIARFGCQSARRLRRSTSRAPRRRHRSRYRRSLPLLLGLSLHGRRRRVLDFTFATI